MQLAHSNNNIRRTYVHNSNADDKRTGVIGPLVTYLRGAAGWGRGAHAFLNFPIIHSLAMQRSAHVVQSI